MRWRAILLAATMLVALASVGGAVMARSLDGTMRDDRLIGSDNRDQISDGGGDDLIRGLGRADALDGGPDNDTIYAGPTEESARDVVVAGEGDDFDRVLNRPAARDLVDCGDGLDRVVADRRDVLAGCDRVRPP